MVIRKVSNGIVSKGDLEVSKSRFSLVLLFSTILSVISSIFYTFLCFLIFYSRDSLGSTVSNFTMWYEFFFFFLLCLIIFLLIIYPILKIYVLIEYHYNNKFHSNLVLVISILSLLNIPLGTILGVLMLVYRDKILK